MTVLIPGQTLRNGQYTIERELGFGRFSISYLAKQSNGEHWVIKVLDPQVLVGLSYEEKERQEKLFWNEADKLSKCMGIPNIAKVKAPFKEGKVLCLPMEYLAGGNLVQQLAERTEPQLEEDTALEYVRQIGSALAVIHEQGIIHRDICPANIYLRLLSRGKVEAVLTNFELAVDANTELSRTRTRNLSDGFSPIEVYTSGQTIGPYTDIYSLAATLYELLTGKVPCSSENRMLHGEVLEPPMEINPAISERIANAILVGMALPTNKRPQMVQAWLTQLEPEDEVAQISQRKHKFVDWGKWGAIWGFLSLVVAILLGIADKWPSLQPAEQPKPQSTPAEQSIPQSSHNNSEVMTSLPLGELIHVA